MSQHTFVTYLRAVLETRDEASVEQFKAEAWATALWMMGCMEEHPNGQVAMSFSASQLDGRARPVLIAYVDEAEARKDHPEEQLINYPLEVVGVLAQEQALDLVIVDGDEDVVLSHEQFLILRDLMALGRGPLVRNKITDDQFLRRFKLFLKQAQDYCQRVPDVASLHLAAIALGGAPMYAKGILKARNRRVHLKALHDMFGAQMEPGDRMSFLDTLDRSERKLIEAINEATPVYVREETQGWWARLVSRYRLPQVAIVQLEIEPHEV